MSVDSLRTEMMRSFKIVTLFLASLFVACEGADLSQQHSAGDGSDKKYIRPSQIAGINLFQCNAYKQINDPSKTDIVCAVKAKDGKSKRAGVEYDSISVLTNGNSEPVTISTFTPSTHPDWAVVFTVPTSESDNYKEVIGGVRIDGESKIMYADFIKLPTPTLHADVVEYTNPYKLSLRGDPRGLTFRICAGLFPQGGQCGDGGKDYLESPEVTSISLPAGMSFAGNGEFPGGSGTVGAETFCTIQNGKIVSVTSGCLISVVIGPRTTLGDDSLSLDVSYDGGAKIETKTLTSKFSVGLVPNRVLGQPDFEASAPNRGGIGTPSANSMRGPEGVAVQGNEIFVADTQNNRVTVWNKNASYSSSYLRNFGQTTASGRDPGTATNTFANPTSITFDMAFMYVSDFNNGRISSTSVYSDQNAVYDSSLTIGVPKEIPNPTVINEASSVSNFLNYFFVAGRDKTLTPFKSKVFIYSSLPSVGWDPSSPPPPHVLHDFTDGVTSTQLNNARHVSAKYLSGGGGTRFIIADSGNHRVLIWNNVLGAPTMGMSHDLPQVVLGQTNFVSGSPGSSPYHLNTPTHAVSDGTRLFVADSGNDRILIWSTFPTSSGQPADYEIKYYSDTLYYKLKPLAGPSGLFIDTSDPANPDLYVADRDNSRVLVIPLPASSGWQ